MSAPRTPMVYVGGPMTSDPWGCVRRATQVADVLKDLGCHAYLPQLSVLHEIVDPQPYEHWIVHGLAMVSRCDAFYRMPGESPGADREQAYAARLQLPIFIAGGDPFADMMRHWTMSLRGLR